MTSIVLRFLDYFQGVFKWLGADYEQLRHIVALKFLMQNRRPTAAFSYHGSQQKDANPNNAFWRMCALLLFFGAVMGIFVFVIDVPYYALVLPFSYAMMMSVLVLVSDFSTLLLDTTDNAVLLPRPVNDRTVLLARLVHIGAYLFFLSYSIMFFGIIFAGIRFGVVAFLACVVLVALQALVTLFVTTLLYMLLIRFTSEERVKDVVSYFQIVFTLLVTVGYQMIGRIFDWVNLDKLQLTPPWWHYLLPPFWMTAAVQWLTQRTDGMVMLALLAVAVPLLSLWVLNRFLAPAFNRYITNLGVGDTGGSEQIVLQKRRSWATRLAEMCTNTGMEKAVFELSWKITSRDRRFKMRTYPSFGSLIPMFFIFFRDAFTKEGGIDTNSHIYLVVIYLSTFILQTVHQQTFFSDDFKAGWVYFVTPNSSPRDVLMGNLKAVTLKFFTPFYLLVAVVVVYMWGVVVLDDLLLCYLVSLLSVLIEVVLGTRFKLPFAKSPAEIKEASQGARMAVLFLLLPFCGLLHWGLTYVPYGVPVACVLGAYLVYDLYHRYEQVSWSQFDL